MIHTMRHRDLPIQLQYNTLNYDDRITTFTRLEGVEPDALFLFKAGRTSDHEIQHHISFAARQNCCEGTEYVIVGLSIHATMKSERKSCSWETTAISRTLDITISNNLAIVLGSKTLAASRRSLSEASRIYEQVNSEGKVSYRLEADHLTLLALAAEIPVNLGREISCSG